MHKPVILAIDDEEAITRMLRLVLGTYADADVVECNDPELAEALLEQHGDRLAGVICDLRMPEVDGIELCRRLRAMSPGLPVIILTAFASPDVEEEARKIGVRAVLEKPFMPQEFAETVWKIIHDES